jgi:hypothetical protein
MPGDVYSPPGIAIKEFRAPVVSVALDQLYTAIRILYPESDVHIAIDETLAAGYSGTMELALPAGVICCQRYGLEWGDPEVKLRSRIDVDDAAHEAAALHSVPPSPTWFEYARFWVKREKLFLYRENTDAANPRTYHLSIYAVMPQAVDWDAWKPVIDDFARKVLTPRGT